MTTGSAPGGSRRSGEGETIARARHGSAHHPAISMSVQPTAPRRPLRAFDRWVAGSLGPDAWVLEIGAGADHARKLPRVRARAAELVGLDPDEAIWENRTVDQQWQCSLEDCAVDCHAVFDTALSVFVLEHVADPEAFTRACAHVLKPGGSLFGLTVNKWHYFGFTTWAASRLGVADRLLETLRERQPIHHHHFRTEYRLNTVRSVTRHLADAGFRSVEFRMWDHPAMYTPYLPGSVKGLATVWHDAAYRLDTPSLMGHLSFRAIL